MWWFRFKHNINDTNITLKPGSHKPAGRPTWDIAASTAWDNAAAYVNIFFYRRHNLSRALTAGLPAKLSWVASWRLSAMKIFYVNIICGDLQCYVATTSQVGRQRMRTRLKVTSAYQQSGSSGRCLSQKQYNRQQIILYLSRGKYIYLSPISVADWRIIKHWPVGSVGLPRIKFPGTCLHAWSKRATVRVKCVLGVFNLEASAQTMRPSHLMCNRARN